MRLFDLFLGITGSGILLAIAAVMIRRGLQRDYPFFFGYIVCTLLDAIVLLFLIGNVRMYFYAYWTGEVVTGILVLLALHEAFHDVFRVFYALWWFRLIFPAVVGIIVFFSIRHAVLNPLPHLPQLTTVILSFDSAIAYVKAGVFAAFMMLVVFLHVRWRRYPYDIALGFAINSLGLLISYAFLKAFGLKYRHVVAYAAPSGYVLGTAVWLWSFAPKVENEPITQWKDDVTPEQLLEQVTDYIRIMKKGSREAQ